MEKTIKRLNLLEDFPPVPTSEWEAAIARDLKGADYDKKLVWKTEEGIAVRPYYRSKEAPPRPPLDGRTGQWQFVAASEQPSLDVNVIEFHESGATAVQEVAFALAQAADLLAEGRPAGAVGLAVGGNHFMQIAKLRAARILLAQVHSAFAHQAGGDARPPVASEEVRIHCRTGLANKTLYDPYANLLRVTTEAMSAIVGGCDSLSVAPCRFDAHLADNVQYILREESHLGEVVDPGAGSYYVEALTDALAREAWALFQQIEAAGGFSRYRAGGALDASLAAARAAKEKAVATRRRVLVGTNNYPDPNEQALDAAGEMPEGWRLGQLFERIRLRTERHARRTGRRPRVLLLERGDLKMRKARAAFCLNLFGCAGFQIVSSEQLLEADLVVLCSSDAEYLAFAADVCPRAGVPVIVAGNPKDEVAALESLGVAGFVHVLSNAAETLATWQDRLGIRD